MSPRSSVSNRRSLNFSSHDSNGLTNKLKSMSMREQGKSMNRANLNKTCMLSDYQQENNEDDEVERDIVPLREKAEHRILFMEE